MVSLFSYLITMFACIFWLLRTIVCVCYAMSANIGIEPLNYEFEIVVLFITLISIVFVIKRNIFAALIYFIVNTLYFGENLVSNIMAIINQESGQVDYIALAFASIGIIIPILTVIDILINKERKGSTKDERTDWFFRTKKYDRKHDERADENQYKF